MSKIIFLDIDGVLNCAKTVERHHGVIGLSGEFSKLYYEIIKQTGAKVVLSSTWRLSRTWRKDLEDCGLDTKAIIGRTPSMPLPGGMETCERGKEIDAWLKEHPEVKKYAILDDDSDMLPGQPLFKTTWQTGLTKEIAQKVIEYLGIKT